MTRWDTDTEEVWGMLVTGQMEAGVGFCKPLLSASSPKNLLSSSSPEVERHKGLGQRWKGAPELAGVMKRTWMLDSRSYFLRPLIPPIKWVLVCLPLDAVGEGQDQGCTEWDTLWALGSRIGPITVGSISTVSALQPPKGVHWRSWWG